MMNGREADPRRKRNIAIYHTDVRPEVDRADVLVGQCVF